MRALEGMDKGLDLAELQRKATNPALQKLIDAKEREGSAGATSESEAEGSGAEVVVDSKEARENEMVDLDLVKKNPSKVYPQIYFGIKKVLKEWEASMAERPGESGPKIQLFLCFSRSHCSQRLSSEVSKGSWQPQHRCNQRNTSSPYSSNSGNEIWTQMFSAT